MGVIKEFYVKVDEILSGIMKPIVDKIIDFLTTGQYTILAVIGVFATLLILVGFFRWLRKAPKLFIFLVIIFGLIITLWVISK